MALVFQYGSNGLDSQINSKDRLCGDAKFIDIAQTMNDFQLAFDVWSTNRKCAASDIVLSPGNKVWGALYEVPDFLIDRKAAAAQNRKSLDGIEGKNSTREMITVRRNNGPTIDAITYRVLDPSALKVSLRSHFSEISFSSCRQGCEQSKREARPAERAVLPSLGALVL